MNTTAQSGTSNDVTKGSIGRAFPMILLALAALAENALVLVSVALFKSLRRLPGNLFIVNLAITDVIGASACMPLALTAVINGRWILGDFVCQFQAFLIVSVSNVTFLTLFSYSVYRHYTVTSTRQPTRKTLWRVVKVNLVLIWTVGVSFSIPPLLGHGMYRYIPSFYACTLEWAANQAYSASVFVIVFFIPQTIMSFSYYRISKFVRIHRRGVSKRRKKNAVGNEKTGRQREQGECSCSGNRTYRCEPANEMDLRGTQHHMQLPTILLQLPEPNSDPMVLFTKCDQFQTIPLTNLNPTWLRTPSSRPVDPSPSICDLRANLKSPCLSMAHIHIDQEMDVEPRSDVVTLPSNLSRFQKPVHLPKTHRTKRQTVSLKHLFKETRLIKLLLFTVLAFYICWTPFAVSSFLQTVGYLETRPPYFDVTSMWLAFANAICNPLIYALLNSQFRKAFSKVLRTLFCCFRKTNRVLA